MPSDEDAPALETTHGACAGVPSSEVLEDGEAFPIEQLLIFYDRRDWTDARQPERAQADATRMRFGFGDGLARTLDQNGSMFDLTRERIRQIEVAMLKLRASGLSAGLREYLADGLPH